jgi:acetyl esterase/lipase
LSLSENLAGAILVSPWVTFQTDSAAFARNNRRDLLTPAALLGWSEAFMGSSQRDNYNHPIDAPAEWWKGVKLDKIAFVAGANELFVDDIRTVVEKVKVSASSLALSLTNGALVPPGPQPEY